MHGAQDTSSLILQHKHSKVFKIIYTNCLGNVHYPLRTLPCCFVTNNPKELNSSKISMLNVQLSNIFALFALILLVMTGKMGERKGIQPTKTNVNYL